MKYVLQVYFNGSQELLVTLPAAERDAVVQEYQAFFRAPEIRDGNQLQPPATSVTVRLEDGELAVVPGPFAQASEPLGGYYVVEVADRAAAIALASRIPAVRMGGAVEIRPVIEPERDF